MPVTITLSKKLQEQLDAIRRVDESLPQLLERLANYFTQTCEVTQRLGNVLDDKSEEWKQFEQRVKATMSFNDAFMIQKWHTACKDMCKTVNNSAQPPANKKE